VSYSQRTLLDDGAVRVFEARCEADPAPGGEPERAARLEIVFPLAGVFVRHIEPRGRRDAISDPTRALFFRPGEPYRVSHPLGGLDRSIDIAVPPSTLDEMGIDPLELPDAVPVDGPTHLLLRRWSIALGRGRIDQLTAAEIAVALVDRVLRPPPRPAADRRLDPLVDRVRLTLADRLGDRLTLPELGALVGSSPFHLARRFRTATGGPIHGYRTALRVRTAIARIEQGERDLTCLALDLGFANHSHLTNVVRRQTGRPPSAFRLPPTDAELHALRTFLQA
jgi:AraC-like DNA-binding protein